jgi:transcription initiation factor IIE alpha subunit
MYEYNWRDELEKIDDITKNKRRNITPNLAIRLRTGVDRKFHIHKHVIPAN